MNQYTAMRQDAQIAGHDPFAGGELSRVVPTTEPQRELWLASQLGEQASLAYNESVSLVLRGALDLERLRHAVQALVARHDALRGCFGPDGETFCIRRELSLEVPVVELSRLSPAEQDAAVAHQRGSGVSEAFDLAHGPLFRASILRLSPVEHVLMMHAHHIVCDGWSWWVLVRDLGALYGQEAEAVALAPAESFADYALELARQPWQAEDAADEAYWLSVFESAAPVLDLPADHPRATVRDFASSREDVWLEAALVRDLRQLGARRGSSLFATLLGGFASLIGRLSGQDDVVVGIPAAGQSMDGHDQLVGHCVNLLPLRFQLDPHQSFTTLLQQAQQVLLDGIEHQKYSFGTLLKKLPLERDPARPVLASVMFNIDQALEQEKTGFTGLGLEFNTNPRCSDNFELSINAVQVDGRIRLECQYASALFEPATIRRWMDAYACLLQAAVAQPDKETGRLPLLDAGAMAELQALQPSATPFDRHCRMHELFERQCDRAPDRAALRVGQHAVSYAQLERRANQVAHLLRSHGVHAGALVGIAVDRGVDMLAGLLGILKCGAGYVPLDPRFPRDRLAYMAGDAGLAALLTHAEHAPHFDLRGRPVLALDTLQAQLEAQPATRPGRDALAAGAESPAYVIYTSGSTGRPKGVQVPHRAVSNFIHSMQQAPGLHERDRLLAVTTLSFDIAVLELMLPLSVGAEILLADKEAVLDGRLLRALIEDGHATVMQATPASWRMLLETGWQPAPGFKMLCGGEPLPPDLAQALLAGSGELWNLYGPTETTVWSTCSKVVPATRGQWPDIHIGRPIANTQVWMLDAQGMPVPRGVAGEICIAGDGVTLGYLQRPELTADRFVPDPFASADTKAKAEAEAPAWLYRTGDRGRWRPDGNLQHMGRLDFQVKVRGYRIELGEIESTLALYPALERAVVVAREDTPGDVRLVAYVVAAAGHVPSDEALATHLRLSLPDYMLPQHYVQLPRIPLLPNGKVDRGSLPAPQALQVAPATPAEAPRDPLEQTVMAAMQAVLGCTTLGREQGFFQLGGHSLLAARLCANLGRELGIDIPLRQLFETPSVARLADALRPRVMTGMANAQPPGLSIPRQINQHQAPMTLMQQRLWLFEQMEPGSVAYNTPSAHRLRGPIDLQGFDAAFGEMIRRQPSLRTILVPAGEGAQQQVIERLDFSLLPVVDLSVLPEPERLPALMQALEAQTAEPFALDQAPLFRAKLYKLGEDDHALYFMTHHVIWDGWSFDVFYAEMSALYEAFRTGTTPDLPALEVSYVDYAHWHRRNMAAGEAQSQVEHWKRHLEGALEPLHLPEDKPRPAKTSNACGTDWVHVDRGVVEALRAIGTQSGATLFMTLLAAYYVVLHRLSGQDDVVVGLPFRNRPSEALEKVMGFFVNVLPLRCRMDTAQSFRSLLEQVRDGLVEAFQHPDVPFEELLRELGVARDSSRSPIYQALFSFQDVRARSTHWGNLAHEHLLMFQRGMGHDLGLWFLEHENGLSGALGYNSDVFSEAWGARFKAQFETLLKDIAQQPDGALGGFVLLGDDERAAIAGFNATEVAYADAECCIHELFESQVARTPDRLAVSCGGESVSYLELNTRANRLARHLRRLGAGPDARIAVCAHRSIDMVVALLAVLKAGAAYVPLDPDYPADRLAYMLEDSAPRILLTQQGCLPALQGISTSAHVLLLDRQQDGWCDESADDLPRSETGLAPRHLAYVIYTSGSTGRPKGAMNEHAGVVNRLLWMQQAYRLDDGDAVLQKTPFSFDVSVWEFFLPLLAGSRLVMAKPEGHKDPSYLSSIIHDEAITTVHFVPSMLNAFLAYGDAASCTVLKRVICSGEALPVAAVEKCRQLLPAVELHNLYGPTEAAVDVTAWDCAQPLPGNTVPIGRPIANTRMYVLDGQGRQVPIGVVGELYIGGVQVGRGYLNRAELTAERFLPDPFAATPGARMYRTGDLGRWRADGNIEYLGRNDFQVKVRGFRIELGEIESVLAAQPGLVQACVIAREDAPGDVRLVAYVVPGPGASVDPVALSAALRETLPAHMVPQHYLALPELPLLPNGKVDRKQLPAPRASSKPVELVDQAPAMQPAPVPSSQASSVPPHVAYMVGVWSELLGSPVEADDDFFAVGGHSMLAVRIFHRINQQTGVNLPLATLLAAPTARQLAESYRAAGARIPGSTDVETTEARDPWAPLVCFRAGEGRPALFFIHAVGGNVLNYQPLAAQMPAGVPVYGLQARGLDGRSEPLTTIEEMAALYVAEIRKVHPTGPYRLAGGSMGGMIAYEMAQQFRATGDEVTFLALIDTASYDSSGPLSGKYSGKNIWSRWRRRLHGKGAWDSLAEVTGAVTKRFAQWHRRRRIASYRSQGLEIPHALRYAEIETTHYYAYKQYRPQPYSGPLSVFRAEQQDGRPEADDTLGWHELVRQVQVFHTPGDHHAIIETPELVEQLRAAFEAAP